MPTFSPPLVQHSGHSRPHSPFRFSKLAGPWLEKRRALETKDFQSEILGLPVVMYAVVMFLYTVWQSHGVFYFRSRFLCFKRRIQKIRINPKIPCPQSPTFLVSRPCQLREAKRAIGTRMRSGQNTDLTNSEFKLSRRNIISFPERTPGNRDQLNKEFEGKKKHRQPRFQKERGPRLVRLATTYSRTKRSWERGNKVKGKFSI